MQAPMGEEHPGLEACMELKTNKVVESEKQEVIFHKWVGHGIGTSLLRQDRRRNRRGPVADDTRKLLKHWAQSWLLGIPVWSARLVIPQCPMC